MWRKSYSVCPTSVNFLWVEDLLYNIGVTLIAEGTLPPKWEGEGGCCPRIMLCPYWREWTRFHAVQKIDVSITFTVSSCILGTPWHHQLTSWSFFVCFFQARLVDTLDFVWSVLWFWGTVRPTSLFFRDVISSVGKVTGVLLIWMLCSCSRWPMDIVTYWQCLCPAVLTELISYWGGNIVDAWPGWWHFQGEMITALLKQACHDEAILIIVGGFCSQNQPHWYW